MDQDRETELLERIKSLEEEIKILDEENRILKKEADDVSTRYREMFDRHAAVRLLVDPEKDGLIVDANRSACQFLGYTKSELCSMKLSEIQEGDPAQTALALKQATNEIRIRFTHRYRLKNGEVRDVEVYSSPVRIRGQTLLFSIIHDISHRVRMENALLDSEDRFRTLSEVASEGILLSENGFVFDANVSLCEMSGRTYDEILGSSISDLVDPGPAGFDYTGIDNAREGLIRKSDGTNIPVEIRIRKIHYRGSPIMVIACLDVTDRNRARKDVEENLQFLQEMMDSIPAPLFHRDREGRFGGWNRAFEVLINMGKDRKMPTSIQDLPEDMSENLTRYDEDVLALGRPVRYEVSLQKPGHEKITRLAVHKSPYFKGSAKKPAGLVCFTFDITEQKIIQDQIHLLNEHLEERVEEEVLARRRREKEYEQVFNRSSDAIIIFAETGSGPGPMLRVNERCLELLGHPREFLMKLSPLGLVVEEDRSDVRRHLEDLEEDISTVFLTSLLHRDGRSIPVEVNASRMELDGIPSILANIRDLSERIRHEEEKQASERMLIQQSKLAEIGEMLGAVAHQWKQPLNIIGFLIQDLEEAYNDEGIDAGYVRNFVQESMDQIRFLSVTIEEFRKFFKPSTGSDRFNIGKAIFDLIRLLTAQMKNHSIELKPEFNAELKLFAGGTPNKLQQVLLNLINNSKDAIVDQRESQRNPESGKITIRLKEVGNKGLLEIEDDGGGILPEILLRLFEPYASSKGESGTGIGLYMAKQIVEREFSGNITAWNTANGTCFRLELPLVSGSEKE